MTRLAAAVLAGMVGSGFSTCGGPSRDVVPETHVVTVRAGEDSGVPATVTSPDAYEYVAKRPHGLVALAEARGLDAAAARAVVDHLADELETCAKRLLAEGHLAKDGAGRVVAAIAADGSIAGLNANAAPGQNTTANLLVCVVSPLKLVTFPPEGDAGPGARARGIALEATWGSGT
jgi:hypothetical protein